VAEPVRLVARLEAQVVAADDRISFMALQDSNDTAWRALQEKRFGRLERIGLPEFGWQAMGIQPIARRSSTRARRRAAGRDLSFLGDTAAAWRTGEHHAATAAVLRTDAFRLGTWHAGTRLLGPVAQRAGKRVVVIYLQRDAAVIEPLLPRLDELVKHACDSLPSPP
jgi:hypothetical protein